MAAEAPEAALEALLAAPEEVAVDELGRALRQMKRRVALLSALCDLGGLWPLESVTGALTRVADRAVDLCLTRLVAEEIRRGKLPGLGPDDAATAGGLVALAMGKMGAHELNYSSDIDLIVLFDQDRYGADAGEGAQRLHPRHPPDDRASERRHRRGLCLPQRPAAAARCQRDAGLPVDGRRLCLLRGRGPDLERAAYIKARPCGGDLAAGGRFLESLSPFVWRKHLDFAAIQDAHDMRLRIRDHRGLHGPIQVEGHNMKLGAGGIREIEFFTQTRQLIAGGRDPSLRDRTTVGGLAALAARGWVPAEVAEELTALYRSHREVEHRLQMVNDAQTHSLPTTAEGVARIAAFCGQSEDAFRQGLLDRLARTDRLTEGFFAPGAAEDGPELSGSGKGDRGGLAILCCLKSERAQGIFRRLRPRLLKDLSRAAHPDEALVALDGFLAGLPSGVQIFSLFEQNPQLVELIVDIAGTSPALARHLSRNAAVLDAVIGGSFWAPWPGVAGLREDLERRLAEARDYEAQLDTARRWMKEWHFRVGVHHLRGLIDGFEAGKSYANLAEAVVQGLWPRVQADFAAKHGALPGRGAVLLGMGSLGAGRLNAASDLDLILIYDAEGVDQSDGRRPLPTRTYYARLTQAMVTALSAQTAEGRLYEVDVRLRPSGRAGAVATSLQSWKDYQRDEAWTWEHLALTRARVMAGDPALAAEVEDWRRQMLALKGQGAGVRADVAEMRARLAEAKPAKGTWEAKNGPGRLMDIELCAEWAALVAANPARQVERQIASKGVLAAADQAVLLETYRLLWRLQCGAKLLTDRALDLDTLGEGGRAFLLRETGESTVAALSARLDRAVSLAEGVIARQFPGGA